MKKHILMIATLFLAVQLCFAAGALAATQLTGTVSITTGSALAYGTNTIFLSELNYGDIVTFGSDPTQYLVDGASIDTLFVFENVLTGSPYNGPDYSGPAYHITVTPLTGTVSITTGGALAHGTNTIFLTELKTGDIVTFGSDPTQYLVVGAQTNTLFVFVNALTGSLYNGPNYSGQAYRIDPGRTVRLTGTTSITTGSALAHGTGTNYSTELIYGDIVLFGSNPTQYLVDGASTNTLFVFENALTGLPYDGPDYSGVTYRFERK